MAKKDNNTLVFLIAGGLAIFLLGGGLGMFYQFQKDTVRNDQNDKILKTADTLSSELVPSMVAFGQVASVIGRDITIFSNDGKVLSVKINENAPIYSYIAGSKEPNIQSRVALNEIKKGNMVNITMKLMPDGSLTGQLILILAGGGAQ